MHEQAHTAMRRDRNLWKFNFFFLFVQHLRAPLSPFGIGVGCNIPFQDRGGHIGGLDFVREDFLRQSQPQVALNASLLGIF
jgi:hypothetical protein